jgi:hypothetical protein
VADGFIRFLVPAASETFSKRNERFALIQPIQDVFDQRSARLFSCIVGAWKLSTDS